MKNFIIIFYYLNSIIYCNLEYHHLKLKALDYKDLPWYNFDKSFYNHVILVEEITAYVEWFNPFFDFFHCTSQAKNSKTLSCTNRRECAMQYQYREKYKYQDFCLHSKTNPHCLSLGLEENLPSTSYLYKNRRTLGFKINNKIDYGTMLSSFDKSSSYKNLVFIKHQQGDFYYYDLTKSIKALFYPFLPQVPNHKLHSQYILIGFSENIVIILKNSIQVENYCKQKLQFNSKYGIEAKDCTLVIDHKCIIKEAILDLNYRTSEDIKQNYLYCIKILKLDHFTDEYAYNHHCNKKIDYKVIQEKTVIESSTGSEYEYRNKKTQKTIELFLKVFEFGVGFIPNIGDIYSLIMLIKNTVDIFSNNEIEFVDNNQAKTKIDSITEKISKPDLYKNNKLTESRNLPHYDQIIPPSPSSPPPSEPKGKWVVGRYGIKSYESWGGSQTDPEFS